MFDSIFIIVLGLVFGSFASVLVHRSVAEDQFNLFGRSACPHCKHKLSPFDLVPLLSYLFLLGRCRYCRHKISWFYPLVEFTTASLFLISYWGLSGRGLDLLLLIYTWILIIFLVSLFFTDYLDGLLPDSLTIPAILSVFVFKLIFLFTGQSTPEDLLRDIMSGVVLFGFFWSLHFFSKGKFMGDGDSRLGLLMGLVLGWPAVAVGFFVSFLVGGVFAAVLLVGRMKKIGQTVPLGPFLVIGTLTAYFWGQEILDWYLKFVAGSM